MWPDNYNLPSLNFTAKVHGCFVLIFELSSKGFQDDASNFPKCLVYKEKETLSKNF